MSPVPGAVAGGASVDVCVVGSANLDLVVAVERIPGPGETVLGGDLERVPGGKGANQAVAAARLGRRVAMVGRVGDDEAGGLLRSSLDAAGVDTSRVLVTPGVPSGVALISVAADGDNAIIVSPGANARLDVGDVDGSAAVTTAAALLLQLEIPPAAVLAAARAATGLVVCNPAPAPPEGLPTELLSEIDVLVPNEHELALLAGHDGPLDLDLVPELARRLPVGATVVTLGAAGALVVADEVTHVPAPRVDPVDTTAAGDAFCAALADRLVAGDDLVTAAAWAVRVGAAVTLRPGAQPSLPTPAEVDALLDPGGDAAPVP